MALDAWAGSRCARRGAGRTSSSSTSTRSRAARRPRRTCSTFDSVHGRWRARRAGARADAHRRSTASASAFSEHAAPGEVPWADHGVDLVLECSGKFRTPALLAPYFERGVKKVIVAAPVKEGALNVVVGVNDHLYEPERAPPAHRRVVHDQLPRAGGQGHPRGHRHPPRRDHHDPRHHQHPDRGRRAAQGSAARAREQPVAHPDHAPARRRRSR